jgi:hypothetical protein
MAKKKAAAKKGTKTRVKVPQEIEAEIVRRCKRRCCMCFGLYGKDEVVDGQLAHLGRDPSVFSVDELAYLCQPCHTKYDTTNNRTLGYKPDEVRHYRELLYKHLRLEHEVWTLTVCEHRKHRAKVQAAIAQAQELLRACCEDVTLNEGPME